MRFKRWIAVVLIFMLMISALPTPTSASTVALAPGYHARWIDRIADLPDCVREFYDWLERNANLDGALADPAKAQKIGSDYVYVLDALSGSVKVSTFADGAAIQEAIFAQVGDRAQAVSDFAFEAYGAFDRDHPEVFWLTGQSQCGMSLQYSHNTHSGVVEYELSVIFYLQTSDFDIRLEEYQSYATLKAAIAENNRNIAEIISGMPEGLTTAEQVRYLNRYLTENNSYNSSVSAGGSAPNQAWKSTSALAGSVGVEGPVCEGYARAFKVLCDTLGIPCVLTEGYARSSTTGSAELHMWNYVQINGSWYAVDVTWNDPTVKGSGNAAHSGRETENYLLVGSETVISSGRSFQEGHVVRNCVVEDGHHYINGPQLSTVAYDFSISEPGQEPEQPALAVYVEYMSVDAYRGEPYAAPQLEGYLFMGWYQDEELTTPLSKQTTSGYAYAVFADEQIANVKCQLAAGTVTGSADTALRLLTGVCDASPEAVVFRVDDEIFGAQGLYACLQYENTSAEELFGTSAAYIAAYTIENIPRERFDDVITVVPGWYTWDGTFVTGNPRTVSVSDGLL